MGQRCFARGRVEGTAVDVTVVSIKVNHDGNAHVAKVDTYPKNKEAGLTWTVAKWDSATPHDSSLYADKWGNVNPSLSASEQLFWKGYTHMTYGMVNGQDYLTRVTDGGHHVAQWHRDPRGHHRYLLDRWLRLRA